MDFTTPLKTDAWTPDAESTKVAQLSGVAQDISISDQTSEVPPSPKQDGAPEASTHFDIQG